MQSYRVSTVFRNYRLSLHIISLVTSSCRAHVGR